MTLAVGLARFGLVLNNYVELTEVVRDGARWLASSRGTTTPYTTAVSAINSTAVNLTMGNLTVTTSVNGTARSTDATRQTALTSASGSPTTVGPGAPQPMVLTALAGTTAY